MPDYAKLAQAAVRAVADAAIVCREVQQNLDRVRAITKDDRSPVTVADFASQAIVGRILHEELGRDTLLVAEEDSEFLRDEEHEAHLQATLAAVRAVWDDCDAEQLLDAIDIGSGDTHHAGFWTLDPIDGTKGFLRNQQYAIALAYIDHNQPVVGVMGCPNLPRDFSEPLDTPDKRGSLYVAIRKDGVAEYPCDDPDAHGTEITRLPHVKSEPVSVCASVEKAHSNVTDTDRILEVLRREGIEVGEPTRLDSQAKYAVVARGQADAYLRMPTKRGYVERIWDHAAGSLVASEAGCYVTDIAGHALDFSHGRGLEKNRGVICAPPALHGRIIAAIEELGLAQA